MTDAPSINLLDEMPLSEQNADEFPLHEIVRLGLSTIIERHFEDGQRFWPELAVSERLHISRDTVRRALDGLSKEGTLHRYRAKGTFIQKRRTESLSTAQSKDLSFSSVGVVLPQHYSDFLSAFIEEFRLACEAQKLTARVYRTHKGETGAQAFRQLESAAMSGHEAYILLNNVSDLSRDLYNQLSAIDRPVVLVDTLIRDVPTRYVGTDSDMGIRMALGHLIGLGHRKIVLLVNEPEDVPQIRTRIDSFLAISAERHIPEMRVVSAQTSHWSDSYTHAYQSMEQLWKNGADDPTAIVCVSDPGAWAVCKWFVERSVRVPEDVSVVGFDDDAPSRFNCPPLTTICHPLKLLVQRAFEMLSTNAMSHEFLSPELIVRESTTVPR